jgi:hypothetical protein
MRPSKLYWDLFVQTFVIFVSWPAGGIDAASDPDRRGRRQFSFG